MGDDQETPSRSRWGAIMFATVVGVVVGSVSTAMLTGNEPEPEHWYDVLRGKAPINVNTAGPEELELLPGIGPTRAAAIMSEREQRAFGSAWELQRVHGLSHRSIAVFEPYVTFEDGSWRDEFVPDSEVIPHNGG